MTLKDLRKQYYMSRARPETHELWINKKDSLAILAEMQRNSESLLFDPLAVLVDMATRGVADVRFKRLPVKFFCDEPVTKFAQVREESYQGRQYTEYNFEAVEV